MTTRPLAIDLFCGLGGWTDGLLAEGWDVIGFDIDRHEYGDHCYPTHGTLCDYCRTAGAAECLWPNDCDLDEKPTAQLVVQDVLTLHGSQFRDAALIVASPPCQEYSYMAMPWTKAKAKAAIIRADASGAELERLNRLFSACFRIQREACEAARHHIPLIIENVRGAQPWVGRSRGRFGSFYLWGDVPALMPPTQKAAKAPGFRFDGSGRSFQSASVASKNSGGSWFNVAHNTTSGKGNNPGGRKTDGVKHHGSGAVWFDTGPASLPSKSPRRKAASALIAKIPLPLSRYIAAVFRPMQSERVAA